MPLHQWEEKFNVKQQEGVWGVPWVSASTSGQNAVKTA